MSCIRNISFRLYLRTYCYCKCLFFYHIACESCLIVWFQQYIRHFCFYPTVAYNFGNSLCSWFSWISFWRFLRVERSCRAQTCGPWYCRQVQEAHSAGPGSLYQRPAGKLSAAAEPPWTDSGTGKDVDDKVQRLKWFSSEAQLRDSDIKAHTTSFSLYVLHAHPSHHSMWMAARWRSHRDCGQISDSVSFESLCFIVCGSVQDVPKAPFPVHPSCDVRNYLHVGTLSTKILYRWRKESRLVTVSLGLSVLLWPRKSKVKNWAWPPLVQSPTPQNLLPHWIEVDCPERYFAAPQIPSPVVQLCRCGYRPSWEEGSRKSLVVPGNRRKIVKLIKMLCIYRHINNAVLRYRKK